MIGLVAFSFALREEQDEPNPCNQRLGDIVAAIAATEPDLMIVSQWEVTRHLDSLGIAVATTVELPTDGSYLDSRMVWNTAKATFSAHDITRVIAVSQPFLQLGAVKSMIRRDGFTVIDYPIPAIGFDTSPLNTQPWTKSAYALLIYAIKVRLSGRHGHRGRQAAP